MRITPKKNSKVDNAGPAISLSGNSYPLAALSDDDLDDYAERLHAEIGHGPFEIDGATHTRAEGTSLEVLRAFGQAAREGAAMRGFDSALAVVRRCAPDLFIEGTPLEIEGAQAADFLGRAIPAVEVEGSRLFRRRLPAYDWIWMIRRLPLQPLLSAQWALTTRILMSGLACFRNELPAQIQPDGILRLRSRHGRSLAFLFGFTDVLSHLISARRWAGKGGSVVIDHRRRFIDVRGTDDLRTRLSEYDARARLDGGWGSLGIHIKDLSLAQPTADVRGSGPIAIVRARARPAWLEDPERGPVLHRYIERFIDLEEVFSLLDRLEPETTTELPTEIGLLVPLLAAYGMLIEEKFLNRTNVMGMGYSVHVGDFFSGHSTNLERICERAIAWSRTKMQSLPLPKNARDLLQGCIDLVPSVAPLKAGPVVFPLNVNEGVVIDWYAASNRLLASLRYPSVTGSAANIRANAFETTVRAAIRDTHCQPAPWLEELFGRHLKLRGSVNPFGEIDAGATLPGGQIHVLVSCKSYQFTDAHERGDYNAVRNVSERLAKDAVSITQLAATLMANREGENYSIPVDVVLIPIVATPRLMYAANPICRHRWLDNASGPRCVSGINELLDFLYGYLPDDE